MGSSTSTPPKQPSINLQDYEELVNHNIDTYYTVPNRRIIKNKFTNLELEQYILEFANQEEMNKYYEVFYWRMTQQNIARTLHFWITKQAQCCSHMCRAKVYTERVVIRLSDIKDIPYPDNLYMLLASADAFDKIVQKIGFFDIQQSMIGVNSKGQIRVWINQDLSSNTINIDSYECKTEKQMAKRLVSIINQNTQLESQPSSFLKYVNSRCSNLSFYDLMVLVRQYAKIYKTNIPTNFASAIDAVKCDPSYTQRSVQSEHSVSRLSNRIATKNERSRKTAQPYSQLQPQQQYCYQIGNNMKQIRYIPSITKLTNNGIGTPTFTRIPSFLTPNQQKNSSNSFQRKYLIQNPTRYHISESRKIINPTQHLTPSMSKVSPISTSPISNYASPVRHKQQPETARKITEKTQNTNNYSGQSKSSFRFLRTDRKTNESSQKVPSSFKLASKIRGQYLPTSPFSQNKQSFTQYYNYRPETVGIDRIPSVQTKLHEYFQTSPATTTHDKQMSSFKSKTANGMNIRKQFSNEKDNFSFERKGVFKDKYQMDPQIAHDLARFYQNH